MEAATYGLSQLLTDSASISTAIVSQMSTWLSFFTTNTAFMWVFIGGVAAFAFKTLMSVK